MRIAHITLRTDGFMSATSRGKYVFLDGRDPEGGCQQIHCKDEDEAGDLADAINRVYGRRRKVEQTDRVLSYRGAA